MHSTQGPSGQWYTHNGDFSGPVKASIPVRPQAEYPDDYTSASTPHVLPGEELRIEVEIPFKDIRALYLRYLTSKQISLLEQATDDERERMFLGESGPAAPSPSLPAWVREGLLHKDTPWVPLTAGE